MRVYAGTHWAMLKSLAVKCESTLSPNISNGEFGAERLARLDGSIGCCTKEGISSFVAL